MLPEQMISHVNCFFSMGFVVVINHILRFQLINVHRLTWISKATGSNGKVGIIATGERCSHYSDNFIERYL